MSPIGDPCMRPEAATAHRAFGNIPRDHTLLLALNDPVTAASETYGATEAPRRDFRMLHGARECGQSREARIREVSVSGFFEFVLGLLPVVMGRITWILALSPFVKVGSVEFRGRFLLSGRSGTPRL